MSAFQEQSTRESTPWRHNELVERYKAACDWAIQAGQTTLQLFRAETRSFQRKEDHSPVTEADRQAERFLREQILSRFPHDNILGEEFGETESDASSPWRWILDPIDGTKSFITGVPLYGTIVAVCFDAQPVIGVVYCPAIDEGVRAAHGLGAQWFTASGDSRPARVRDEASLQQSVFLTSERAAFDKRQASGAYTAIENATYFTRTWGDCYGYLLVATGRADVMIDPQLSIWDAAAMLPIMQEAGGVFLDWRGEPKIDSGDAIAANPGLAQQVLALLKNAS